MWISGFCRSDPLTWQAAFLSAWLKQG